MYKKIKLKIIFSNKFYPPTHRAQNIKALALCLPSVMRSAA